MTKMIVRTSGGKIRAAWRDQTTSPYVPDPSDGPVNETSEPMPTKKAPWVAISTALLSPVAAWLLERLDRRGRRHKSAKGSASRRLKGLDTDNTARITVRTSGGRLRIRLGAAEKASACSVPTTIRPTTMSEDGAPPDNALSISRHLVSLMEMRAESAFRPDQNDVELVYALSGSKPNVPDMLHTLSSNTVVEEASENHIVSCVREMVEHIRQERDNEIGMVVEVHTHPQSSSRPSEQDRRYFASAAQTIQRLVPNAQVLFGVHAISGETEKRRGQPVRVSRNTIRWNSINREHEIAFYTADTQPYEIRVVD